MQRLRDSTLRAAASFARLKTASSRAWSASRKRACSRPQQDDRRGHGGDGARASAGEAIARILEVESPGMIATFGVEPDLVKIMQYPDAAIACDCGAARNARASPRLRHVPARARSLRRASRAHCSLAEAVRKMTALPATIVGMVDRGFIAVGMAADLTVFDTYGGDRSRDLRAPDGVVGRRSARRGEWSASRYETANRPASAAGRASAARATCRVVP